MRTRETENMLILTGLCSASVSECAPLLDSAQRGRTLAMLRMHSRNLRRRVNTVSVTGNQ
jgi:hypothetical protein